MKRLPAFLFPIEPDNWLAVLRIGLGIQTILYVLSLRSDWNYLLGGGETGAISRDLAEKLLSLDSPLAPRLGWLVELGARGGVGADAVLSVVWFVLLCAGIGLLIGLCSRLSAVLAWFLHLCAAKSSGVLSYGVDNFMTIGLFYLMLAPVSDRWSIAQSWPKSRAPGSQLIGFFRRILQLHLCVIYFFSGLTKCLGSGWWDGSNIWRALIRPPSNVVSPELLVHWKYLLPVAGVFICLLETGYPVFIWNRTTRTVWLLSICAMHVAIGITLGMYLFASVMIVLNVAAFAPEIAFLKISPIVSNQGRDGHTGKLPASI